MAVVGGARQIGQAGIGEAGEFLVLSLRFYCAVGQRFPELDAAHPAPRPLVPLTNGSRPVTGRPAASRRGDR